MLVGLTRVRNESLIIADTIRHLLSYCSHVILFDDCSTDDTVKIAAEAGGKYITIICNDWWRPKRVAEETRHRVILLECARQMGADWCLYMDADERLVGELPELKGNGFRFNLFDGYLTAERQQKYTGGELARLPRMWGPEFRDIIMLFRVSAATYKRGREPYLKNPVLADTVVKHYGKCLSVEHFEETCDYYIQYFAAHYGRKWQARKGRAIHTVSDMGNELYTWHQLMSDKSKWCHLKTQIKCLNK